MKVDSSRRTARQMQLLWPTDKRDSRGQKSRQNSGARRRPAGSHVLASGKNREQAEWRQCQATPHRGQEFWKNLFGGNLRRTGNQNPDDAPPGTRLAPRGEHRGRRNHDQRPTNAALRVGFTGLCACLAAILLAEGCRTPADPQAVYNQINLKINRGELTDANRDVDLALKRGASNVEWLWRFRILKARILASQSD